ncbi:MAG: TetR/AcrR family transcriptional regulator [Deltaproteobacteria bacterium]|nr:TetR/AcrR family transcriptional regulator [Deltaproteobacteria bacterium]MBW2543175.1 TetR/AcrR family transcriptional regulator [Deltaproteobacteria bacterium]
MTKSAATRLSLQEDHRGARRQQLIEAAMRSIAEHGIAHTTVARVAEEAGLSQGIMNFYFEGKQALLLATLEYVESEFQRGRREKMRSSAKTPEAQLDAIIEATFDPAVCNPLYLDVWDAFWGEARARADFNRVCSAYETSQCKETIRLFRKLAKPGQDVDALGTAFFCLLESRPERLGRSKRFDLEGIKRTCRAFLATVFPANFGRSSRRTRR